MHIEPVAQVSAPEASSARQLPPKSTPLDGLPGLDSSPPQLIALKPHASQAAHLHQRAGIH